MFTSFQITLAPLNTILSVSKNISATYRQIDFDLKVAHVHDSICMEE